MDEVNTQDNSAAPPVSGAGESNASLSAPQVALGDTAPAPNVDGSAAPEVPAATAPASGPARESLIAHVHAMLDLLQRRIESGVVVFGADVAEIRYHIQKLL